MSTVISPSLLACDFLNIEEELMPFEGCEDLWFHLDIMDGHFVPNLTFGHPIISLIKDRTNIPLDAHLMVNNPRFYIETFKNLGIHNLTWHVEASSSETLELINLAKESYKSVGLSIKPKTPLESITPEALEKLDLLLIMSVEPGFGGQKFIEETYSRIEHIDNLRKENNYTYKIQVDGGVKDINASNLIKSGADNLVAGSYVFKNEKSEYINSVNSLRD